MVRTGRAVRAFLHRDHPLHRERPGNAHRPLDDLRLVHQLLRGRVGGDALVDFIHLRPPRGAAGGQRFPQGLRPVRIGVEGDFPFLPFPMRNLLAVLPGLSGRDALERLAGGSGPDPFGRRVRQEPAADVGIRDGAGPFLAVLVDELVGQCRLQVRADPGGLAVQRGELLGEDRFVLGKDGVERGVAGDAAQRDVRDRLAVEGQLFAGWLAVSVHLGDPGSVRVSLTVLGVQLAKPVVVEFGGHQAVLGQ